jgi:hypothetical protein
MKTELKDRLKNILKKTCRYSPTAANEKTRCALRRIFADIEKEGDQDLERIIGYTAFDEPAPAIVGGAIHRFLELYENHCYSNGVEQDIDGGNRIKGRVIGEMQMPAAMEKDYSSMANSIIFGRKFDLSYYSQSEVTLSFKFEGGKLTPCKWDDPKAFVKGKIDKLYVPKTPNQLYIFTDYKSNRVQFGVEDDEAVKQLKIYAVLYSLQHPELKMEKATLSYDFIRSRGDTTFDFDIKRETPTIVEEIVSYVYDFHNTTKAFFKVLDALTEEDGLADLLVGFYKPKQNQYCGCRYMHLCPLFKKALATIGEDVHDLDFPTLQKQLSVQESREKMINNLLRQTYKNDGPIDVGAFSYGYVMKRGVKYKGQEILLEIFKRAVSEEIDDEVMLRCSEKFATLVEGLQLSKVAVDNRRKKNPVFDSIASSLCEEDVDKKWMFVAREKLENTEWA